MSLEDLRSRDTLLPVLTIVVGLVLDRATKVAAESFLTFREAQNVLGEYLRLVLWYNEGAAFGLKLGSPAVHIALSIAALAVVGFVLWQTPRSDLTTRISLALIISGALGNLWDRMLAGKVTDFIDVGIGSARWPTFNIADSLVVIGIGLLVLTHLIVRRPSHDEQEAESPPEPERATAGPGAE